MDWIGTCGSAPGRNAITKPTSMPYKFRWWKAYSSQMGNWGVHYCDGIRWILGDQAPTSVSAHGGRFAIEDDRTVPDTMQATFELPSKALLIFGQYEANGGPAIAQGELEFRGTLGNLYMGAEAKGYAIVPTKGGQFQSSKSPLKPEEVGRIDGDLTDQHTQNFADCVKSRQEMSLRSGDGASLNHISRTWPTSLWQHVLDSSGMPRTNGSPTTTPRTNICITNTVNLGNSVSGCGILPQLRWHRLCQCLLVRSWARQGSAGTRV